MPATKPVPGSLFPNVEIPKLGGGVLQLGNASDGYDWQLIVVYRGKHCPICTRYLRELNEVVAPLNDLGIEVVAISADQRTTRCCAGCAGDSGVFRWIRIDRAADAGAWSLHFQPPPW